MFHELKGDVLRTENAGQEKGAGEGLTGRVVAVIPGKGAGPRRLMTSFQMDADVARVLAQVEEDGRLKSRFINEACRRLGRQRGYVRGRRRKGEEG